MNTSAQALVFAFATVTAAVGIGSGLAEWTAQPTEVVQLEKVVVVGKHVDADAQPEFVTLPRVVVVGHRSQQADAVQVAAAEPKSAAL